MRFWLLKCFARLPLPLIHGMGVITGWIMYFSSKKFVGRVRNSLTASGFASDPATFRRLLRRNITETGKSSLETLAIWFRPYEKVLDWVRTCQGWEHVETALQKKKGIIFLTPHLGCFEITSLYYGAYHPVSVLYRPPRQAWLEPLIQMGRARGQVKLAQTNLQGVRSLLKALKKGEAIGILPDQVPDNAEGEWANFFGKPAYTMTLASRLAEATGATVLMAFGERLPWGKGFVFHIEPFVGTPDPATMNATIEALVRRKPDQYFWSYQRYKIPSGTEPPTG